MIVVTFLLILAMASTNECMHNSVVNDTEKSELILVIRKDKHKTEQNNRLECDWEHFHLKSAL